jgi:hypothetical protein
MSRDKQIEAELQFHIERLTEDNVAAGTVSARSARHLCSRWWQFCSVLESAPMQPCSAS